MAISETKTSNETRVYTNHLLHEKQAKPSPWSSRVGSICRRKRRGVHVRSERGKEWWEWCRTGDNVLKTGWDRSNTGWDQSNIGWDQISLTLTEISPTLAEISNNWRQGKEQWAVWRVTWLIWLQTYLFVTTFMSRDVKLTSSRNHKHRVKTVQYAQHY